jgi:tetratricopeptide (TPR) repeat protein
MVGAAAEANNRKEARRHFNRAEAAYRLGHFLEAIEAYEAAYKAMPAPAFLFNIAQAYRQQYTISEDVTLLKKAITLYRSFLREVPKAKTRPMVENILAELQTELESLKDKGLAGPGAGQGQLVMRADPPLSTETAVSIDGKMEGSLPLSLSLPAGEHVVRVTAVGYRDWQTRVNVSAQKTAELLIHLAATSTTRRQARADEQRPFYKTWWFWTLTGGLVATGAGAGIYFATRGEDSPPTTHPVLDLR